MRGLIFILLLAPACMLAQTSGDQYYINLPDRNPAFTGIDNLLDVHLLYRKTSSQFASNPSILAFSVFGKLGKVGSGVHRNNSFRVSDPDIYASESAYISRKHGLGLSINSFKLNGYNKNSISLNYAYHVPVHKQWALSLGASLKLLTERFNVNDLTVRDPFNDDFYKSVTTNGVGSVGSYAVAFGGALYSENWFVGFGSNNIIRNSFSDGNLTPVPVQSEFYLLSGKTISLNSILSCQPTLQISYDGLHGESLGGGIRARYKSLLWTGVHYVHERKISYLLGINVQSKLRIYYTYDQFTNDWRNLQAGNHEVIIRIPLLNQHSLNTYTW